MRYRHTQTGPMMLLICVIGLGGAIWLGVTQPLDTVANVLLELTFVLLVIVGLIASRLTVSVDDHRVSTWFGWGWPRRTIVLADVASAERVRNSWWYGWGVRKVPGGWMFNNAGYGAIELRLASGTVFRIGTDEPDALLAAIDAARRGR
jgi:hypothetical protein